MMDMKISAGLRFGAFCEKWLPLCMAGLVLAACAFAPADCVVRAARETAWICAAAYLCGALFVRAALKRTEEGMPPQGRRMLREAGAEVRLLRLHRGALAWLAFAGAALMGFFASEGTRLWAVLHLACAAGAAFAVLRSAMLAAAAAKLARSVRRMDT